MELRHLRYFLKVAELENISQAAAKLHVTQPALSRQIRDLEEDLGVALFTRSAKSLQLTAAGRFFMAEALAVVNRAQEARDSLRIMASGHKSTLHLAHAPSLTVELLPQLLRAFQEQSPGVKVVLHDYSSEEMVEAFQQKRIQGAIGVLLALQQVNGLQFMPLREYGTRIAISPLHPLAQKKRVRLQDLARERLIVYNRRDYPDYHLMLQKLFDGAGLTPLVAEEHDSVTGLVAAIEAGRGVAMVSESLSCYVGARLRLLRLMPAQNPMVVGVAWPETSVSEPWNRFLEVCLTLKSSRVKS